MQRVEQQLAVSHGSSRPFQHDHSCVSPPLVASELSFSVTENSSLLQYQRWTPPRHDGSASGAMPRSHTWQSELMEWRRGNLEKGRRGSMITQTGH
jgi:hypothetical protein